jgi:hypothetical protein
VNWKKQYHQNYDPFDNLHVGSEEQFRLFYTREVLQKNETKNQLQELEREKQSKTLLIFV